MNSLFQLDTISKKLLFILMSVSLSSIIIITFVFSAYEVTTSKQDQVESLDTLLAILSPNITAAVLFDDEDAIQELIDPILLRSDVLAVNVIDTNGLLLASTGYAEPKATLPLQGVLFNTTEISTVLSLDNQEYGQIIIEADDSYIVGRVKFYSYFIITLLLFTLGVSFFLSLYLRRRFLSPILHLAKVAELVSKSNDYSQRAKELSQDEVGQLTSCFNEMLHTIEQRDNLLESKVKSRTEALETANVQLHEFAYIDGLTELPNRRYFYEKLQSLIDMEDKKFIVIFIDLDGFKEVNDTLGHDYGDLLLHQVAKRLRHCVRAEDTVARLGGDEFTLIIENIYEQSRAIDIAKIIKNTLMNPLTIKGKQISVTGSIGLTFYPKDGKSLESLLKHADQAMYLAKNNGRNRYEFFSYSKEEKAVEKRQLIEELRLAINNEQFELFYQPIFACNSHHVTKAEALIRWNHPARGLVEPNDFIPIAEECGLIIEIGNWVRKQALIDTAHFQALAGHIVQVSVNTSPLEIDNLGLWAQQWQSQSQQYQLPKGAILIEVTENTLMTPGSAIQQQMKLLGEQGINLAIDDFGVGYSSLAYLQQLDIDILKIDRSFITDLETNDSCVALVRAIVTMAHNLGVKVVAEGIEQRAQYDILEKLECDYFQGYMLSKPLQKRDFIEKFLEHTDDSDSENQSVESQRSDARNIELGM
ncbi:bifunctional diguanylate cyclase/phosphodiesterase [Shewanella donghaensis]|uniref:bifunctional diguanylate cyclase/phosphodiesterase n=1 Tax=Shewanella donghaensis TaxID=238836 RepID=UPI001182E7F1|nr:EAL domain-containing protein [Shewanella donghaensis]